MLTGGCELLPPHEREAIELQNRFLQIESKSFDLQTLAGKKCPSHQSRVCPTHAHALGFLLPSGLGWLASLLLFGRYAPPFSRAACFFRHLKQEYFMTLIQELMNQAAVGGLLNSQVVKRFSPAEIRETIQSLVATEQLELANALGDAGLSLYPNSDDILAITSLLAMMNQDWPLAVELIDELMAIQGANTPPFTYVMLVRALRCNLDPARALQVARDGLALYPQQVELLAEKLALDDFSESMMPVSGWQQ